MREENKMNKCEEYYRERNLCKYTFRRCVSRTDRGAHSCPIYHTSGTGSEQIKIDLSMVSNLIKRILQDTYPVAEMHKYKASKFECGIKEFKKYLIEK